MTITTKLTQKDHIKANFATITARPYLRFVMVALAIIILSNIVFAIKDARLSIATVMPPIIIFGIYASVIYFSFKKSYSSNKRASETVAYTFDQENLSMIGESFKSELSWDKVYMVTKSKNWLLIWQSRQIANAIPERDFSGSDLTKLKAILTKNGVKNNL